MTILLVALATALGGGSLGVLLKSWFGRHKVAADAAAVVADASVKLIHEYQATVADVRVEVEVLKVRLTSTEKRLTDAQGEAITSRIAEQRCMVEVASLRLEVAELRHELTIYKNGNGAK